MAPGRIKSYRGMGVPARPSGLVARRPCRSFYDHLRTFPAGLGRDLEALVQLGDEDVPAGRAHDHQDDQRATRHHVALLVDVARLHAEALGREFVEELAVDQMHLAQVGLRRVLRHA